MPFPAADPVAPTRDAFSRRVVVIGFGSPIRGDDAVGPLVADQLADEIDSPQVEVLSRHILTAELAEKLRDATLVLFLDASTDGPIGQVVCHAVEADAATVSGMAHSVDAPGLLAWTWGLYGHAPQAVLLSTRAVTLDYAHCQLSPPVASVVRPMMDQVLDMVREHLQGPVRERLQEPVREHLQEPG
ncbi:MAG: hydrogenase maturation protease [Pirellulaceae bacterium]